VTARTASGQGEEACADFEWGAARAERGNVSGPCWGVRPGREAGAGLKHG